jgi:hypothetical protein
MLPLRAGNDPSNFDFPIFHPSPAYLSLTLVYGIDILAKGMAREHRKKVTPDDCDGQLIGGFGKKGNDDKWSKDIVVDTQHTAPVWVVEDDGEEGRWKSETLFKSLLVFTDSPSGTSELLTWEVGLSDPTGGILFTDTIGFSALVLPQARSRISWNR